MLIFDFSDPGTVSRFHSIGDSVMGGVSSGTFEPGRGYAVFQGEVSFRNQGGFASVRTVPGAWDLSSFEGIELQACGDGKTYKFSLTTEPRYDSVVYRARFSPEASGWSTVTIPFTDFFPTFRGSPVPGAPPLEPSAINTLGILISDRQEGPFRLLIKSISAYGADGAR